MAKFTAETARKAQAARAAKRAARLAATAPDAEQGAAELLSTRGQEADVVVPPQPSAAPTIEPPPPDDAPTAPTAEPAAATPFTPEIAKMLANIAFDVAGVATGKPHIYKATDAELDPLMPALAHQLQRIPIVRAIGPDNTELTVLVVGLGVMVTRRLNEHADEKLQAQQVQAQQAQQRPARPTAVPAAEGDNDAARLLSIRSA